MEYLEQSALTIGDSQGSSVPWPRAEVIIPESIEGRDLTEAELTLWAAFEQKYAPLILGDEAGDGDMGEMPDPMSVGWCSLYALALYVLAPFSNLPSKELDSDCPQDPQWLPWRNLLLEFWKRRNSQLRTFQTFLGDWGLNEVLKIPKPKIRHLSGISHGALSHDDDDRTVLGFHQFHAWQDVTDYALRWGQNPLIRDTHLWQHRITVSRGIDLICSELLANGFEHGGSTAANVFIVAKLCSHRSASFALSLDARIQYLTTIEKQIFALARQHQRPILQLCIGDAGHGFGGNAALRKHYQDSLDSTGTALDEGSLIKYALSGKVTTKTRSHRQSYWRAQLQGQADLTPTHHGLSEVRRFIRKMHGYWRIHSGATIVDQNFLNIFSEQTAAPEPVIGTARSIRGCLHYIMIPLLSESTVPTVHSVRQRHATADFTLIDAADDRLAVALSQPDASNQAQWIDCLCDRIFAAKRTAVRAVLLHLSAFDNLSKQALEDACLELVQCLHLVRDDLAVYLSGTSEETRYQLSRYTKLQSFDLEYKVLPFLHFRAGSKDAIELQLACSDVIEPVRNDLIALLLGDESAQLQKSDNLQNWELFRRVHVENLGLFRIASVSTRGDEVLGAHVRLPIDDADAFNLLCGGMSFSDLTPYLLFHTAVAPHSVEGYFRLGDRLSTYIHLGRLWADLVFQQRLINWLQIAFLRAQSTCSDIGPTGKHLVLIAVLHPAIELAHELIRYASFADAEIVEIRRVSDLRWDYEPLANVQGKVAAILIDIVLLGKTVSRIVKVAEYIGLEPWACFSVLSVRSNDISIPEYAFCRCTREDLERLPSLTKKGDQQ